MQTSLFDQPEPQMQSSSRYHTTMNYCNCPFSIHHPDKICRHRLEIKNQNQKEIIQTISDHIGGVRETRDKDCGSLQGAVDIQDHYRHDDLVSLIEIALRVCQEKGTVCSDDLHVVTNEAYRDDKIVGTVFAVLVRSGVVEEIGRKPTIRKCAHGKTDI